MIFIIERDVFLVVALQLMSQIATGNSGSAFLAMSVTLVYKLD